MTHVTVRACQKEKKKKKKEKQCAERERIGEQRAKDSFTSVAGRQAGRRLLLGTGLGKTCAGSFGKKRKDESEDGKRG